MRRDVETVSALYDYLRKFKKTAEKLEKIILDPNCNWEENYDEQHREAIRTIKYIKGTIKAIEKKGN